MDKDYYEILGVVESDTPENIKLAYRKLARKWHPDIAGNSSNILKKFKEINEAYEILSDKVKKEEYDRARRFYNYAKNGSDNAPYKNNTTNPNPNTKAKTQDNTSAEEYFKNFTKNIDEWFYNKNKRAENNKTSSVHPLRGEDIYTEIEITVMEAITGVEKVINMLQSSPCPKCSGRKFVNGGLCPSCNGKGEKTQHKKFTVKIPAGIKNGAKIRLSKEGSSGINGGENGDLYITIKVQEQYQKTEGLNIIKTIFIQPFEAVLGTMVEVKTMNGCYNVKIPQNTQNGQKIRLTGCGIVQNEKVGDMIIVVEIRIPKSLSGEEINLYKTLAKISSHNIRDSIYE